MKILKSLVVIILLAAALLGQAPPPASDSTNIRLNLTNTDLMTVVNIIAGELKMNWVADPSIKGAVTISTMGDLKRSDLLPLLQAILRVNGATAVENNGLWRIVPIKDAARTAISPVIEAQGFPTDDRLMLDVIPLRYASVTDMTHLLSGYLSDAGSISAYEPGNILLITDTSRSLQRLVELLAVFDSESFAGQRVRLFPATNSSARALAFDLTTVFAAYALTGKSPIQFLPVERLNGVLVISPNPAAFAQVEKWVKQLDVATRPAGIRNYVYKVQNAAAEDLQSVLVQLYGGYAPSAGGGYGSRQQRNNRNGTGGGGYQAQNNINMMSNPQSGIGGGFAVGNAAMQANIAAMMAQSGPANAGNPAGTNAAPGGAQPTPLAGTRQAPGSSSMMGEQLYGPRIVADTVNNMLIVQCSPPEWVEIESTLKELDVIPRQVLIEAQIFEVDLTGELSMGVSAFLQSKDSTNRQLNGSFAPGSSGNSVLSGSVGLLVGHSRELLTFLTAVENRGRVRTLSAPSVLASDNQDAKIDVGTTIPVLTSVGYTGAQQTGGGSIFTNSIQQQDTGVILTVSPRVNSGGLVTMHISQEVSVAGPPPSATIPSPTIQKRSVDTQVTVQDGQTIALGGIIQDQHIVNRNRLPILGDIPWIGGLFGNTTTSSSRTELIVMVTPHVVKDLADAADKTEELRKKLKEIGKMLKNEK